MRVLIADDDHATCKLLERKLVDLGHQPVVCHTGDDVLGFLFRGEMPQLVFLDWMMPGTSGVEVCRKIREVLDHSQIFILMITSRIASEDVITSLRAGANDYVTKPLNMAELQSRLALALRMVELNNVVAMQKLRLVAASKLAVLGQMAAGIAHEINNPLAVLSMNCEILKMEANEETILRLETMDRACTRISNIIRNLREFAAEDDGAPFEEITAREVIERTLSLCARRIRARGIRLETSVPELNPFPAQKMRIVQVVMALIENSLEALNETVDPWLTIDATQDSTHVMIAVTDNGSGVPAHLRQEILHPFFSTKGIGHNAGLGLSAGVGIAQFHQGSLTLDSVSPFTRFVISLPFVHMSKTG